MIGNQTPVSSHVIPRVGNSAIQGDELGTGTNSISLGDSFQAMKKTYSLLPFDRLLLKERNQVR
jgi:hypothetical protein